MPVDLNAIDLAEEARVRAIVQGIERTAEKTVTKITLDVTANLQALPQDDGTPRDTGWASANWVPAIGEPHDEAAGQPGDASAAAAESEAGKAEVLNYSLEQGKVFVSNNVPYITRLNEGHSQQVAPGFVQRAIEKAVTTDILDLDSDDAE